jgi:aspartate carbamoyltransferase regulatory subunit
MKKLDLSAIGIAAGHLIDLANAIKNNTHLIYLDLSNNGLVDSDFCFFMKNLSDNNTLKTIKVENASLSDQTIEKLENFCQKKNISLINTPIQDIPKINF